MDGPDAVWLQHARAFIRAFVLPARRPRYLQFAEAGRLGPERRGGRRISHGSDLVLGHLDLTLAVRSERFPLGADLLPLLRDAGAPDTAWCVVGDALTTGFGRMLAEAVELADWNGEWAFSCLPGRLAFTCEHEERQHVLRAP